MSHLQARTIFVCNVTVLILGFVHSIKLRGSVVIFRNQKGLQAKMFGKHWCRW